MSLPVTVRVDSKGRLTIPRDVREGLDIEPGTTFFLQVSGGVLSFVKAENPFEVLAHVAEAEYRQGHTRSLLEFVREQDVEADAQPIV
jgi:AbrB family looped-hinge helix DNA binding protein